MRTSGSFDYLRDRLSAQDADTTTVGSPFDYKESTLLCLPADLPDRISISIETLEKIDDKITVADLPLGKGVKVLTSPEDVVARVIYQAVEVVEEVVKEAVAVTAEPEVIARKKEEDEEEEAE